MQSQQSLREVLPKSGLVFSEKSSNSEVCSFSAQKATCSSQHTLTDIHVKLSSLYLCTLFIRCCASQRSCQSSPHRLKSWSRCRKRLNNYRASESRKADQQPVVLRQKPRATDQALLLGQAARAKVDRCKHNEQWKLQFCFCILKERVC